MSDTTPVVYLHILGSGATKSAKSNSKGHLFEQLVVALFEHLKMQVTHRNRSANGLEIDIEGRTLVGNVGFFAECKAQEDPLDSPDIQQFGFKFLSKRGDHPEVRALLFSLSPLNTKARELWDSELEAKYGDQVACYFEQKIVTSLIEHYSLASPTVIQERAKAHSYRSCGDTQLLCIEGPNKRVELFWAQLLMSSDGTEPNQVMFFTSDGSVVTERSVVERLLDLKPDLKASHLSCINLAQLPVGFGRLDDVTPARRVVRVRMSKSWFDYRFPAAPAFFVGRRPQRDDLARFIDDVRKQRTSTRGFLVSGRSGIGKSSFALKARDELQHEKVVFLPIDSRLCDDVSFVFDSVNELLVELRQLDELNRQLQLVRVLGLDSLIETLTEMSDRLVEHGYIAVLFFDQFEKVFEYPDVARAVRTLFLRATQRQLAILFGFSWKSDLWSLAEGFPHSERDDIVRESYPLIPLAQFRQEETNEVLKQLETQWGTKLSTQLHKQLAIFSCGLPWLLKKVCAHVLDQHDRGVTQNELIETNLKLQDLFEADLAGLDDEERTLLRAIAPFLPTTLRRLSESFEISNIDRSLWRFIDKRILVKITEDVLDSQGNVKYDAYSDIFREFLITGNVPMDDAYYFYMYPRGALKFFEKIKERGTLSMEQEVEETGRQIPSIYNLSRDLRSLGLVDVRNKVFTLSAAVNDLPQEDFLSFLQGQLKRNRAVSLTLAELNENATVGLERLSELLQELFPSVQANEKTWGYYSGTMAAWLHEARLAFYDKRDKTLRRVDDEALFESVVERGGSSVQGFRLPMCFKNSIVECLEVLHSLGGSASLPQLTKALAKSHQSIEKVLSDTLNLQFTVQGDTMVYSLTPVGARFVEAGYESRRELFRQQCCCFQVFNQFLLYVEAAGANGILARDAAELLARDWHLELAEATIDKLGAMLANWAEYADLIVRLHRTCMLKQHAPQQMSLF